ncbi:MAG: hypothetical protein IJJ33_05910 [Victivallales bacterium]|nr:hypothetical protein [Victivallales bacterium]
MKFHSPANVFIVVAFYQRPHALCAARPRLDFNGDEAICRADEKILLKRGICLFVVNKIIPHEKNEPLHSSLQQKNEPLHARTPQKDEPLSSNVRQNFWTIESPCAVSEGRLRTAHHEQREDGRGNFVTPRRTTSTEVQMTILGLTQDMIKRWEQEV